jgi:hypothetical protein
MSDYLSPSSSHPSAIAMMLEMNDSYPLERTVSVILRACFVGGIRLQY